MNKNCEFMMNKNLVMFGLMKKSGFYSLCALMKIFPMFANFPFDFKYGDSEI